MWFKVITQLFSFFYLRILCFCGYYSHYSHFCTSGQKHCLAGHAMAKFGKQSSCDRCRDKGVGSDPCTLVLPCDLCVSLAPQQKEQLGRRDYIPKRDRSGSVHSDSSHHSAGTATMERLITSARPKQLKKKPKKDRRNEAHEGPLLTFGGSDLG